MPLMELTYEEGALYARGPRPAGREPDHQPAQGRRCPEHRVLPQRDLGSDQRATRRAHLRR